MKNRIPREISSLISKRFSDLSLCCSSLEIKERRLFGGSHVLPSLRVFWAYTERFSQ